DNGSFAIVGNTLKTAAVFDYEANGGHSIRVRGTDADGSFVEEEWVIGITAVNEAPTAGALTVGMLPDLPFLDVGFPWSDPEGNVNSFTVVSLPGAGTLYVGNTVVQAGDSF